MSARREELKRTFEQVPELYDRVRPAYPHELFDDLVQLAALPDDAHLLELGSGTGIATLPLAKRGFDITCLEIGAGLVSLARQKLEPYPRVRVIVNPFEDYDADGELFDLVYAATSWHWLDPDVRYQKAASVLKADGSLAFFSAIHAFPQDADPFFQEIQEVYDEIGLAGQECWFPGHDQWPPPVPEQVLDNSQEIAASGLFNDVSTRRYVWDQTYTSDEYLDLLSTFSGHIALEKEKREFLFDEIRRRIDERQSRSVRRHWLAILHVAQRNG